MKRILVRMSALATVVALGLIAIAQAQRGVQDRSGGSSETVRPNESAAGQAQAPSTGELATVPGRFPGAESANPLRPSTPLDAPGETIQTSGELTEPGPQFAGGSPTLAANEPMGPQVAGPLTPLAAEATGQPAFGSAPSGVEMAPGSTTVQSPPAGVAAAGGPAYPPVLGPGQSMAESGAAVSQIPPQAPNYDAPAGPISGDHVPGAFNPDPRLPTSSIPGPGASVPYADQALDGDTSAIPGQFPSAESPPLGDGTGTPGSANLEGAQSPHLTIQKFAPVGIQVGKPASFRIVVQNSGQVAAHDVQVQDEIPKGTRFLDSKPTATRGVGGELVWTLGTMNPEDETTIEIELMPVEEGEIGSVATVHFSADASAKTIATKPELVLESSAPREVLIGDEVVLKITISNPGSGVATGVVLEERIPPGLQHPAGSELEYEVGDLEPNTSREIELHMTAERPGPASNLLIARGDANLRAEERLDIEILAPDLAVRMDGPKRRYLDREAVYTLSVENPGTAPAKDVDLVVYLPHGLKFVNANNAGYYDESKRAVRWRLEQLPVAEVGTVKLTTVPTEAGEHALRLVGTTPSGLTAEEEQPIVVEGIAAILFEVVDVEDPIEQGGETTYEIRVLNQGSKVATNVRVAAVLPPQMKPVAAEGPPGVQHAIDGNNVIFEGLARLAPKADTTYRIRVQGLQPGDLRVNVQLIADELQDWVTKQESTRVYADE